VRRADCRALRVTECIGIGHSSSSGVISRPSRRASNSRSSAALSISRLASVSSTPNVSRRDIIDLTPSHPFRGLYRSHPIHQGGKFSAGWFDHAGQVGPCPQRQVGHRQAPGCRKLSATATSSRPGDVRPNRPMSRRQQALQYLRSFTLAVMGTTELCDPTRYRVVWPLSITGPRDAV
jgi:hypothetical protein